MAAWDDASWLLRLDPQAIADLRELLVDPSLDPKAQSLWLSALAKAGTPEAQSLVLAMLEDARAGESLRGGAAAALFDVVAPTAELTGGVAAHVAALKSLGPVESGTLLALGSIARCDDSAQAIAALESFGDTARRLDAEDFWLDALANARSHRLDAIARRALDDPREHVREAGVRALGQVEGEGSFAALREIAASHAEPRLRCAALQQLAPRPEAGSDEVLLAAAEADRDPFVRKSALIALARRGIHAVHRTALERLAQQDADDAVRALAQRMLHGR